MSQKLHVDGCEWKKDTFLISSVIELTGKSLLLVIS